MKPAPAAPRILLGLGLSLLARPPIFMALAEPGKIKCMVFISLELNLKTCQRHICDPTEAVSTGECTDLHGRKIPHGIHYVPGPDACTLCVCDNGGPKLCKAVLCSPPQDCKTFIMGNFCCEFICLDTTLPVPPISDGGNGDSTADLGLRLVASGVTAILSLSLLFFLIHRLRQRRIRGRQNRQLHEDQRSLGSVGYITGSIGYLPGSVTCLQGQERVDFLYDEPSSNYAWWKPPENYFPRGEAPPPYEEAVAAAQAEAAAQAAASAASGVVGAASVVAGGPEEGAEEVVAAQVVEEGPLLAAAAVAIPGRHAGPYPIPETPAPPASTTALITANPDQGTTAIRSDVFYEDVAATASSSPSSSSSSAASAPTSSSGAYLEDTEVVLAPPEQPSGAQGVQAALSEQPIPTLPPPPEIASVSSTPPLPLSSASATAATNLTAMNDLNKSNCSCYAEDNDDYRSECENCKSARGSRYLDEPNITPHQTMTLHRRPPGARLHHGTAHGYQTSLTLPSQARRHRDGALLHAAARDAAVQRFSLQLVLDWSDSSSSSLTLSPERRTGSPSSSSETSSDINTHI